MNYPIFIIFQISLDLFVMASIIYLVLSTGRKAKAADEEGIRGLINKLTTRINAANSVAERISTETEKGLESSREMIKTLEARRAELQRYLERIDNLLKAMDETLPAEGAPPVDRYKEASRLAEEGYGIDEIVKMVGLPKGEVQLILGLKR